MFFASSNVSLCSCFYSAMLQLLQLALFSSAFVALADEHKFMPPPPLLALLDIFPNGASVHPSTKSPSVTPSKLEVSNYGLHPLDIHSYRILFYDLRAGAYHPQRLLLHTLCPFLMLFANLLEHTCPLFFFGQPHLLEACLCQPFVLAARWRLAVVLFPLHAKGRRLDTC